MSKLKIQQVVGGYVIPFYSSNSDVVNKIQAEKVVEKVALFNDLLQAFELLLPCAGKLNLEDNDVDKFLLELEEKILKLGDNY